MVEQKTPSKLWLYILNSSALYHQLPVKLDASTLVSQQKSGVGFYQGITIIKK